jgi:hypothetical protein
VADELVLVLAPESATLSETFSLLCHMDSSPRRKAKHIILNRVNSATQAKAAFEKFSSTVLRYLDNHVLYCGHISLDDNIRNGFSLQHPVALYPDQDPSCARFFRLAQALATQLAPAHNRHQALYRALQNRALERSAPTQENNIMMQEELVPASLQSSDKEQFMQMPAMADELIDSGLLSGLELRALVDSLIATGKHEFPKNFAVECVDPGQLSSGDSEDSFQQSLLGLLQQNRSTDKSLDQMLNDFLDEKH